MNAFDLEIDTGKLRWRVALQRYSETPDSYGQKKKTWATVGTYWAFLKPLSGRELVNALRVRAEVSHAVIMRWNPAVTVDPSLRLAVGTRYFNISSAVNVEERNVKLSVLATEQAQPKAS